MLPVLKLIKSMKRLFLYILASAILLTNFTNHILAATCSGTDEIETAIGCISTKADGTNSFFGSIIKIAVGLGGGLALVLMLYGVFIITTSAGIPDKLKEGSEIITSAIAGLIFILLSVFLLNLIGINILGLPGLA